VLAERLRARHEVELTAAGRSALEAAGAQIVCDTSPLGQVGLAAVVVSVPTWWRVAHHLPAVVRDQQIDAVVPFACRQFSLMLLKRIRSTGSRIAWVYPPGDWVQGDDPDEPVMRAADLYVCAFDWQAARYERHGARVLRVPHHSVLSASASLDPAARATPRPGPQAGPVVALLPGSRPDEVGRLMPIMAQALRPLVATHPGLHAVVSRAPGVPETQLARHLTDLPCTHAVVSLPVQALVAQADAAVVCCGTATTETAVADCPQVIVYKPAWLTAKVMQQLGRRKDIRYLSMINLGLNRRAVPELLHADCTPDRIAAEVTALLDGPAAIGRMRADYAEFRAAMSRGSWDAAADAIAELAQRE
jgi:lipid-A-disaccharide synthase